MPTQTRASSVPFNTYPLATEKGEAIPLTVLRPLASKILPIGEGTVELPDELNDEGVNLIEVFSTGVFTIKRLDSEPPRVIDGWDADTLTCQPDTPYFLVVGKSFYVHNEEASVTINLLTKWAQIANLGKYRGF